MKVKLYFNQKQICLGGQADNWWQENYDGDYHSCDDFWIPYYYSPTGRSFEELQPFIPPPQLMEALHQVYKNNPLIIGYYDEVLTALNELDHGEVAEWLEQNQRSFGLLIAVDFLEWLRIHDPYESLAVKVARETGLEVIEE